MSNMFFPISLYVLLNNFESKQSLVIKFDQFMSIINEKILSKNFTK